MKDTANPIDYHYEPKVNVYEPLDPEIVLYYQSPIWIMQWMVELGHIEIATEVSMLLSHNTYPRKEHFLAALHIISYLKGKHNSHLDLDLTYLSIVYETYETEKDWTDFYGDVKEEIVPNAPTPFGKSVHLRIMVNGDHKGDKTTRRSHTGFIIFVDLGSIN